MGIHARDYLPDQDRYFRLVHGQREAALNAAVLPKSSCLGRGSEAARLLGDLMEFRI